MKKALILALGLLVLMGCATSEKRADFSGYVWPKPPRKARIKLLEIIKTDIDIMGRDTTGKLFGAEPVFTFKHPNGVAVDSGGRIYASDSEAGTVYILDRVEKSIVRLFESELSGFPKAIALDEENGLVAVAASNSVNLYDIATRRRVLSIGLKGNFISPSGLAFDPAKKIIFIADKKNSGIFAYDYNGRRVSEITGTGLEAGELFYPTGIATDRDGRLYVVDTMNFRVQVFNSDGSLHTAFGEHGEGRGKFARPGGITVSRDNLIIVTDTEKGNFQVFTMEGKPLIAVGRSGSRPGRFNIPAGIFIDKKDKLYVVDQKNKRIQVFQLFTDHYYEERQGKNKDNK